jgi:hypothetical protein
MKKLASAIAVLVLVLAIPGAVSAQKTDWDGHFHGKDFSISAGLGLGFGYWGYGFQLYPGVEYTVADWKIGGVVPLALGVAGRGVINFDSYWGTGFGLGPFAILHLGFKGLDIPKFLQNFDLYTALGLVFTFGDYYTNGFGIGFASYGGFNYFFTPKLAVFLEGNYWGYYGGTTLGVLFKLK